VNAPAAIASFLAIASTGWASRRVSRILVTELSLGPFAAGTLTATIALGVFLSVTALVAREMQDFDTGLYAAAIAGALFAAGAALLKAPRERDLTRADRATELAVLVVTVGMLALYAHLAFKYQMHDEFALFGHKSMVEQLRRGRYPVYFPPMPEYEARYHYGFDVLAGVFTRGFGVSSDVAIDFVTLLTVLLMCWAAAAIAFDAGAPRSAPMAVLAIHLGSGLAAVLLAGDPARHPRCLAQYHHPTCNMDLYPTQIMNVFQHPVSLGLPMFLALVILLPRIAGYLADGEPRPWKRRAWWIAATVSVPSLAGLALSQLVFYGLACLGALAALPLYVFKNRKAWVVGPIALIVVLGLGWVLANALGGMLAEHPQVDTTLFARRAEIGFPAKNTLGGIALAHAANLGIGFLVLPVFAVMALTERRPQVLHLFAFACGGILVAQLYNYQRSWDIVKFPSASSFALSLLFVVVIDRELADRPFPWVWVRRSAAGLLMASGITAAMFAAFPLPGKGMKLYDDTHREADPLVRKTIDWWRAHDYEDDQLIYAQKNIATQLAVYGGLSTVGSDTDFYYLGITMKELARREWTARKIKQSMDRTALDELGVKYVMLSDEEIKNLGVTAQQVVNGEGEMLELVFTADDPTPGKRRRIWRVRAGP
jgi:hypothetical protein